jgi:hypothetical protein
MNIFFCANDDNTNRFADSYASLLWRMALLSLLPLVIILPVRSSWAQQATETYQPYRPHQGLEIPAPPRSVLSRPTYEHYAQLLMDGRTDDVDFMTLRAYYADVDYYDPLSQETLEKMLGFAYVMESEEDTEKVLAAQAGYEALLQQHIANIAVVSQALSLARHNPQFGNVRHLEKIRNGLFQSVISDGDGKSLDRAHVVVTMEEELMLLNHFGYEVLDTQSNEEGLYYYNMHSVVERKTQIPYTIFVNVSFPMRHINRDRQNQKYILDIFKR